MAGDRHHVTVLVLVLSGTAGTVVGAGRTFASLSKRDISYATHQGLPPQVVQQSTSAPVYSQGTILLTAGAGGLSIFLFSLCVFRDVNGVASDWSRMYKESKGIPPDGFTVADVPTIKFLGFIYMFMGVLTFVGITLSALE